MKKVFIVLANHSRDSQMFLIPNTNPAFNSNNIASFDEEHEKHWQDTEGSIMVSKFDASPDDTAESVAEHFARRYECRADSFDVHELYAMEG